MSPEIDRLAELLTTRRVLVLTGAGLSTDSGIPDYRGDGARFRKRPPMTVREFLSGEEARRRYWARSFLGWPRFSIARPNAGHRALAGLRARGQVAGILTQNVDRLHHRAGAEDTVELHGALEEVVCLGCKAVSSRAELQVRLAALNPDFAVVSGPSQADGDVEIDPREAAGWVVAPCDACGDILKPRVVFFGENVPPEVTRAAFEALEAADALWVIGSSLTVFSGYRFVLRAASRGLPIAILNQGPTRGDPQATLRIEGPQGPVLEALASRLG